MNSDRLNCNKNIESFRTMQTYYGNDKCVEMKGLDKLAVQVVENYDYGNCQVVVPTEASMAYGKIFNTPANPVSYKGYYNVPSAYYSGQSECGNYRMRSCQ